MKITGVKTITCNKIMKMLTTAVKVIATLTYNMNNYEISNENSRNSQKQDNANSTEI